MATPQFQLYGSSPDVLAQQQQNYERLWTGAAEGNRQAATQAQQFNINAYLQAQREDEAARKADRDLRINLTEYGNRLTSDRDTMAEGRRRFDVQTGLTRESQAIDKLRVGAYEAKEKERVALQDAKIQQDFAESEAEEGMIADAAELEQKYPSLSKEMVKFYTERSKAVRAMIDTEFKRMEDAADKLNAAQQLKRSIQFSEQAKPQSQPRTWSEYGRAILPTPIPGVSGSMVPGVDAARFFFGRKKDTGEKERIKGWTAQLYGNDYKTGDAKTIDPGSISQIEARIMANQELMQALTVDPATGEYRAPERPPWLSKKTDGGANRTRLVAEAEAAIRAGADPVKVRERLAQLTAN